MFIFGKKKTIFKFVPLRKNIIKGNSKYLCTIRINMQHNSFVNGFKSNVN